MELSLSNRETRDREIEDRVGRTVWCTYLGTLVAELHDGQALGVSEESRQFVGERQVLLDELLDVGGRLAGGRGAAWSVEHEVQLVDDECVEVVLVADGH